MGNDARPPGRLIECFAAASADFARRLGLVGPGQWAWATPCPEWDVRHLANHMTRGNLNYALLAHGGSGADFLRLRDADALGTDPAGSYASSVRTCAAAFAETGVLDQSVDYPLGEVSGRQALAIRIADTVVHTWDLARATGTDDQLDTSLVTWIDANVDQIYAGLPETPVAPATSHRFFAAPEDTPAGATRQDRLLHLMGRTPDWRPPRVPSIG